MENRIDSATEMSKIPKETRDQHKGFLEWNSKVTKQDHQSIVQVILVFLFIYLIYFYALLFLIQVSLTYYGFNYG
jgi:hypothetical protein